MRGRRARHASVGCVVVLASIAGSASALGPPIVAAGDVPAIGDLIERAAPPGARQVVGAIRLIDALNGRNRVYREARSVQRDVRVYYDAQIETARRQLLDRELLGLDSSQVRQYQRVVAFLTAERDAALAVTEDEKRAAKFGFESKLRRELTDAIVSIPRVRAGLEGVQGRLGDLSGELGSVRAAIESNNPLSAALDGFRDRIADFDRVASVGELIGGRTGQRLAEVSGRLHALVDEIERPTAEALAAVDGLIAEVDRLVAAVDGQLESGRRVSAASAMRDVRDQAAEAAMESAIEQITGAGGGPLAPVRAAANAIVREAALDHPELTPAELTSMRERVEAAVLGRTNERIGELCGRLVGAARRAQLDGQPAPPATPCTLYGNPEALQAVIDAGGSASQTTSVTTTSTTSTTSTTPTTTTSTTTPRPRVLTGELTVPETVTGGTVEALSTTIRFTVDLDAGTFTATVEGVGSLDAGYPCSQGSGAVIDTAVLRQAATSSGTVEGRIDPNGAVTGTLSISGATTYELVQPYTDNQCVHLNADVPEPTPYTGSGSVTGTVAPDGTVTLTTEWTSGPASVTGTATGTASPSG